MILSNKTEKFNPATKTQKISAIFKNMKTVAISSPEPQERSDAFLAADSHPGLVRPYNEDSFAYCSGETPSDPFIMMVADGIGGHGNGNYASNLLVRMILTFWRGYRTHIPLSRDQICEDFTNAIQSFNRQIFEISDAAEIAIPMGTTLAFAMVTPEYVMTLHLGDSRIYLVRGGKISQITQDHTYISKLLREGTITPEQAAVHPLAHVILRSIGPQADADPEINFYPAMKGDRFVLCSDGLTGHVSDAQICSLVNTAPDPAEAVHSLIRETLRGGAKDNVTVVCAFI